MKGQAEANYCSHFRLRVVCGHVECRASRVHELPARRLNTCNSPSHEAGRNILVPTNNYAQKTAPSARNKGSQVQVEKSQAGRQGGEGAERCRGADNSSLRRPSGKPVINSISTGVSILAVSFLKIYIILSYYFSSWCSKPCFVLIDM